MIAVVVAAALLFWVGVFAIYFTSQGISPVDFILRGYEPYDPKLATWQVLGADQKSGLVREERLLLPEGLLNARYLERQVRHRDPSSGRIVSVDPATRVRRRRLRSVRP